jgi:hypothetical protein
MFVRKAHASIAKIITISKGILCLGVLTGKALAADPLAVVTLSPGIPVVVSEQEEPALHLAVSHLRRDLHNVLGEASPLYHSLEDVSGGPAIVVIGPNTTLVEWTANRPEGIEAHRVFVSTSGEAPYLVLQGADTRGSIYAVYTASETFLEIPPLWFWASFEPQARAAIDIPADTDLVFESPYVRYRGWYPNDQTRHDLWRQQSGENAHAWAESMLRLKLNTIVMDYIIDGHHRFSQTARIGHEHGLILANTHISPLGTRVARNWSNYWNATKPGEDPPALTLENIDLMFEIWEDNIRFLKAKNVEVVWTLAFRGDPDRPFWNLYPDAPKGDAERGAVIEAMLQAQVELLRKHFPDQAPVMRTVLYNEVSDLYADNLLKLPDDPDLIWNFVAARRDHFPPDGIRDTDYGERELGYYMNFQFTSTGSHFAQAEGPWKMEQNYRAIDALNRRPLAFAEVNMGNIREHLLEGAAYADMMWNWHAYSSDHFVETFFNQYFGAKHSPEIAQLYRDFIDGYWQPRKPTIADFPRQYLFQDLRYLRLIDRLLDAKPGTRNPIPTDQWFQVVPEDNHSRDTLEAIIKGTAASDTAWSQCAETANRIHALLAPEHSDFFNDLMRTQIVFMKALNRCVHELALSLDQSTRSPRQSAEHRENARQAFALALAMLDEQNHGRFEGWNQNLRPGFHQRTLAQIKKAFAL